MLDVVSCFSLVRLSDASCWPITCGGKKVRGLSILKLTQQYTNNWEANILLFKCIIFLIVDVPLPGYGRIYSILSDDKRYNVTIRNFLWCSCVYFVAMLALGGLGTYMQCKHVYHILQLIMFCGLKEDFIHYCMWSWDEVQCLLQHSKALGLLW